MIDFEAALWRVAHGVCGRCREGVYISLCKDVMMPTNIFII